MAPMAWVEANCLNKSSHILDIRNINDTEKKLNDSAALLPLEILGRDDVFEGLVEMTGCASPNRH